jgi:hypothetical protein
VTAAPAVDLEALLVALVLAPATFSRNRFFTLYSDAGARRVRRRASLLRSIVRQLVAGAERVALAPAEHGGALLTYDVPALGLKRTATLDVLELAVIRCAVARGTAHLPQEPGACPDRASTAAGPSALPPALLSEPADTQRIERALARLLPGDSCEKVADASACGDHDEPGVAAKPLLGRVQHDTQAS